MSRLYSKEILDKLCEANFKCVIVFKEDGWRNVYVGTLTNDNGRYYLAPLTTNEGGISFSRSCVKQIILFNGLIYPKTENGRHKSLDIIELSELINKAGYEFI